MKNTTLIVTALVSVLSASSAFAWWGDQKHEQAPHKGYNNCSTPQGMQRHGMMNPGMMNPGMMDLGMMDPGMMGHMGGKQGAKGMRIQKLKKLMNRTLTADQVRTLQEARLIYLDNPNIKVGKVKAVDSGYNVTIVTQDDSLVRELDLAKNGMNQTRYDTIKQRMDLKQQRKNNRTSTPAVPSK